MEAITEQVDRFLHTDFTVVPYEGYVELAERLGALVPISGETRGAFFNAGTEAVENAVKLARLYTRRQGVIAFEGAFHGRTMLALTMTSKTHPYKKGLGPFAPEVYRAPFPNAYRGPDAATALAALERLFTTHVSPDHVAAIVFEPQQGEGGFIPAPPEFVEGLRKICDEHGIVLVADEVQTGFGRTGRMFAMEHFDVEADLIVVAKSIAGGLPLSGVIGRAEIMDDPHLGAIGGTFIGNPVALAAALAVLDVFEEEQLVERAQLLGDGDPSADARLAGALAADRRCPRDGSDAGDRARPRSGDEGARSRARRGRRSTRRCSEGCCSSRPASTGTASACSARSRSRMRSSTTACAALGRGARRSSLSRGGVERRSWRSRASSIRRSRSSAYEIPDASKSLA